MVAAEEEAVVAAALGPVPVLEPVLVQALVPAAVAAVAAVRVPVVALPSAQVVSRTA